MNMMAISFNLDWFLTIPGLLISGGVILLLIALIIFIVTGAKSKKEHTEEAEEVTPVMPEMDAYVAPMSTEVPMNTMNSTVEEMPSMVENTVVEMDSNMDFLAATPVEEPMVEEIPEPVVMPEIVMPQFTEMENRPVKSDEMPQLVEAPVVFPEMPVYTAPVVEPMVTVPMEEPQVMEQPQVQMVEPSVSIYGGVDPTIGPVKEPEHRPIYGGADPLEATQRMAPIMPSVVEPEVMPIINEATLTEPNLEETTTFPKMSTAFVEEPVPYTVESAIPDVVGTTEEVVQPIVTEPVMEVTAEPVAEPVPVEVEEKIEEL